MNEIYYEFKELKPDNDLSRELKIEIILHFLSKVEEFLILYETKIEMERLKTENKSTKDHVIAELQRIFNQVDSSINLVKGKIREIYLSYSS
jgi:RNA processing factor Prp31